MGVSQHLLLSISYYLPSSLPLCFSPLFSSSSSSSSSSFSLRPATLTDRLSTRNQSRPRIYLPNEFVILRGDRGREMFFIIRGTVQILGLDGQVVRELDVGDFFGEAALLTVKPRNATVLAKT